MRRSARGSAAEIHCGETTTKLTIATPGRSAPGGAARQAFAVRNRNRRSYSGPERKTQPSETRLKRFSFRLGFTLPATGQPGRLAGPPGHRASLHYTGNAYPIGWPSQNPMRPFLLCRRLHADAGPGASSRVHGQSGHRATGNLAGPLATAQACRRATGPPGRLAGPSGHRLPPYRERLPNSPRCRPPPARRAAALAPARRPARTQKAPHGAIATRRLPLLRV